ncbi:MAG: hypothetical protein FJ086_14385, partial [Deltaproteobacteria bacterium]|nr:hypothetical protein [Deltaproteobacteria bacterium]
SAILLSDTFNAVLRRVDLSNGAVTTVAGRVQVQATADGVGTAARFQGPRGMAVNASGTVAYVADGPAIRRVDLSTWTVTTIAGTPGEDGFQDGTGAAVRLGYLLHALELSADSEVLYIADRSNRVLRALTLSSGELVTVAGWPYTGASRSVDGVGTAARFSGLGGMARVGDALYVADTFNHTVRRVSLSDFSVTTVAGAAGVAGEVDGAGTAARFDAPQGLAVAGGALYTAGFSGTLRRIGIPAYEVSTVLGVEGESYARDGQGAAVRLGTGFAPPIAHPTDKVLWYQDRSANSLRRVDLETLVVQTYAGALEPELHRDGTVEEARFVAPAGLAVNAAGTRWYVADAAAQVIREVDTTSGTVRTLAGSPGQWGAVDGTGDAARFDVPLALAYEESSGRLYVADTYNGCLRTVEVASGAVATLAGRCGEPGTEDGTGTSARLLEPVALALDVAAGRLFFSEAAAEDLHPGGRAAIRQVMLATGEVTTLAGGARATAMPLDGAASSATFDAPTALAWDQASERLFIAEQAVAAIRALHLPSATVSLVAGKYGERGPADGSPMAARFDAPSGLALDVATRTLLVSDSGANTLRRLSLDDGAVSTFLGDPSRGGGFITPQPLDMATLYLPTAPVVAGGVIGWLGETAVYRVSTQEAVAP